jgi:hypothetical protein
MTMLELRPTMADLLTRLRTMIGDVGTEPSIDDVDLQAILDQRRTDALHAPLVYRPSVSATNVVEYHDYYGRDAGAVLPWEAGATFQDVTGAFVVPDVLGPMHGHWRFTASRPPPIYITGAFYDLYGAASQACQMLAGKVAQEYDYQTDGHEYLRSQQHANLVAQAREFARRAVPPGPRQSSFL